MNLFYPYIDTNIIRYLRKPRLLIIVFRIMFPYNTTTVTIMHALRNIKQKRRNAYKVSRKLKMHQQLLCNPHLVLLVVLMYVCTYAYETIKKLCIKRVRKFQASAYQAGIFNQNQYNQFLHVRFQRPGQMFVYV